jgi:microcystin-dependent protein
MAYPVCTPDATNLATPAESDSIFCIQAEIRAIKEYMQTIGSAQIPTGTYVDYIGAEQPPGWLFANQEISRTDYADLFNLLGTSYGAGDGSTTFNLPNLLNSAGDSTIIDYTDLPISVIGNSIVQLPDGRLFIAGGKDESNVQYASTYFGTISGSGSTQTITWASGTAMPFAGFGQHCAVNSSGQVCLFGFNSLSTFLRGTISGTTISWTTVASAWPAGDNFHGVVGNSVDEILGFNISTSAYAMNLVSGIATQLSTGLTDGVGERGVCNIASGFYVLAGGRVGTSTPSDKTYLAYRVSTNALVCNANTALPTALRSVWMQAFLDGSFLAIGIDASEDVKIYRGTLTRLLAVTSPITWEDMTASLSSLVDSYYMRMAYCQLFNGAMLIGGGGSKYEVPKPAVKSYMPSRVIIKT